MNPEDKFRGKRNFHERQAENRKRDGMPSDHQRAVKTGDSQPDSIAVPKMAAGGVVQYPMSVTLSMSDMYTKIIQSSGRYCELVGVDRLIADCWVVTPV